MGGSPYNPDLAPNVFLLFLLVNDKLHFASGKEAIDADKSIINKWWLEN